LTKQNDFYPYKTVPVADLIPYARNARTHSDAQVAQIAASIREFGFTNPVLIDGERGVIAGHGRLLAARKLGLAEVPAIELAHLTAAQKRAYILADNKLALNAGWDDGLLAIELGELKLEGFDLALTGFGGEELAVLLADKTDGLTDPDEVPEPPAEPVSRLGDVWLLGRHRIVCGDSTTTEAVDAALAGVKPHLMVTDPPYGVEYDASWREAAGLNGPKAAKGKVLNDARADWSEAWALFPGDVAYVWQGDKQIPDMARQLADSTQKPVECMRRPIENNSSPGQAVYEPFSGSGTTIIAAEMTGRSCHAIELSPAYVDVAVLRWQAFTGQAATLDGDGRSFAEHAAARTQDAAA
jgi:hypothetical protein